MGRKKTSLVNISKRNKELILKRWKEVVSKSDRGRRTTREVILSKIFI